MHNIWAACRALLKARLTENKYKTWIEPLRPMGLDKGALVLGCPNAFFVSWVKQNYITEIISVVRTVVEDADQPMDVRLVEAPPEPKPVKPETVIHQQVDLPQIEAHVRAPLRFNPRYTFDRFVVGSPNKLAYAASMALATNQDFHAPCLYLASEPGLGKSHLSQALGQHILKNERNSRVYYLTAEDFANEMVYSLKNKRVEEFKNKFRRGCDVLVLEEIQFLSGKEKIQSELAYALDYLMEQGRRVVFTANRLPKDIPRMGRHLTSRLSTSLISSISPPDYETRLRIMQLKAAENRLEVPLHILEFLADRLTRDIRQMESCLNNIGAKSGLLGRPIDLSLAKESICDLVTVEHSIKPESIRELICRYYQVTDEEIRSRSRKRGIVLPRNVGMYLCRQLTDMSLEEIGRLFGRNHSTVLYSIDTISTRSLKDGKLQAQIEFLARQLKPSPEQRPIN